jgi:hypothetical protein
MIFKFLPDARLSWRDVRLGAALTTALFLVGKYALGLYLGSGAGVPKCASQARFPPTAEIRWTLSHTLLKRSVDSPACHENSRQLGSTIASAGFGNGETEAQSPARARS